MDSVCGLLLGSVQKFVWQTWCRIERPMIAGGREGRGSSMVYIELEAHDIGCRHSRGRGLQNCKKICSDKCWQLHVQAIVVEVPRQRCAGERIRAAALSSQQLRQLGQARGGGAAKHAGEEGPQLARLLQAVGAFGHRHQLVAVTHLQRIRGQFRLDLQCRPEQGWGLEQPQLRPQPQQKQHQHMYGPGNSCNLAAARCAPPCPMRPAAPAAPHCQQAPAHLEAVGGGCPEGSLPPQHELYGSQGDAQAGAVHLKHAAQQEGGVAVEPALQGGREAGRQAAKKGGGRKETGE
jgi:hypothetical protein